MKIPLEQRGAFRPTSEPDGGVAYSKLVEQCRRLGDAAYGHGPTAPAQDRAFMDIVRNDGPGRPMGWILPLLDAWNAGFHSAHAASVQLGAAGVPESAGRRPGAEARPGDRR